MFLLGVTGTCDDCTVTAASQEPCYRLWPPLHLHTLLHSFGLKNSNKFEKFQPVLKKFKPKKNLNHKIIMTLHLCQDIYSAFMY